MLSFQFIDLLFADRGERIIGLLRSVIYITECGAIFFGIEVVIFIFDKKE